MSYTASPPYDTCKRKMMENGNRNVAVLVVVINVINNSGHAAREDVFISLAFQTGFSISLVHVYSSCCLMSTSLHICIINIVDGFYFTIHSSFKS